MGWEFDIKCYLLSDDGNIDDSYCIHSFYFLNKIMLHFISKTYNSHNQEM